jgi:hypothetical protein
LADTIPREWSSSFLSKGKDSSAPALPLWISRGVPGRTSVKVVLVVLLLAAFYIGPHHISGQDRPSAGSGGIHGTVVNSLTHEPIARALVFSPDNRFAAMTDDQGRFELTFPQAASGNATGASARVVFSGGSRIVQATGPTPPSMLMARKPGFLAGDVYQPQYQQAEPSDQNVVITLIPEALIVGRVTLPTSEPPDRITVEIYRRQIQNGYGRWVSSGTTRSKSNGEFRFSELPAGEYKLFTHELMDSDSQSFPGQQAYGYAPAYFPNVSDFGSAGTIQLTAGKTFQAELSLVRQPYYPVKVAVADAPPGSYLDVQVWAQGRRGPGYSLGYNPQNQTVEGLLPNGTYTLEVAGVVQNLVSGSASITVHGATFIGSGITVVPSRPITVNVKEEFSSPRQHRANANDGWQPSHQRARPKKLPQPDARACGRLRTESRWRVNASPVRATRRSPGNRQRCTWSLLGPSQFVSRLRVIRGFRRYRPAA